MIVLAWLLVLRAPVTDPSDRYDRFKAFYNRRSWRSSCDGKVKS